MQQKSIIAIMGPSGAGKTTLGSKLAQKHNIAVPTHTTTREPRPDDAPGFYRYISEEEFENLEGQGQFLISSGDRRHYGVLMEDCELAWQQSPQILLYTSYKDVEALAKLPYKTDIVALTFQNIGQGVRGRIEQDESRFHTVEDVQARINSAQSDDSIYRKAVERYSTALIYTDVMGIEQTLQTAEQALELEE